MPASRTIKMVIRSSQHQESQKSWRELSPVVEQRGKLKKTVSFVPGRWADDPWSFWFGLNMRQTFSENWRCIWSYWRWEKNMWLHCVPLQNCLETDFNEQVWKDEQVWKGFAWKTWIRIWRDEKSGKVFPERRRKVYIQYIYNNKEWTGK